MKTSIFKLHGIEIAPLRKFSSEIKVIEKEVVRNSVGSITQLVLHLFLTACLYCFE